MAEQEKQMPWFSFLTYLLAAGLILYVSIGNRVPSAKQLVYSEFLTQVQELTFHGEISTGASNDLERASELARQMVTRFGMSAKLGNLTYGKPLAGRFLQSPFTPEERNYSDRTAELIDEEVHRLIDESYDMSRSILLSRHIHLEHIARELIEKETLDRTALDELIRTSNDETDGSRKKEEVKLKL